MSTLVGFALDTFATAGAVKGFSVGDYHRDHDGKAYVYVQASAAIAAGDAAFYTTAYSATALSTSNDARGNKVGIAPVAFAANEYGWLQVDGPASVNAAALAAANVRLNTTATAGRLDDDGTAGSMQVQGVYLTSTVGATAAVTACVLTHPYIDVTL